MDLFQQCESDFLRVVGLMKRHESSSGAGRRPDELLREAEELVARLRIEAGSLPGEEGKASLAKVRRYQEELASLQNVVKQTPNSYRQARRDLTGNPAGSSADAQRQKLLDSTSTLDKTGQRLTESRQLLAGMEGLVAAEQFSEVAGQPAAT
ncbi:hypothetical protein WJX75_000103 [Coccomyxa subellipsoidea]|uniref:Vesicle transport v-SNARE N-terminal domain-containing protein n=1 Tax=Coccomyxa subellipsoidea TaxID=248742 RepID=A0ABR2YKD9_9CHLO